MMTAANMKRTLNSGRKSFNYTFKKIPALSIFDFLQRDALCVIIKISDSFSVRISTHKEQPKP